MGEVPVIDRPQAGEVGKPDEGRRQIAGASRGRAVRRIAFWVIVALVSFFLLAVLLPAYPLIAVNWLPNDAWLAVRPDHGPADVVHRLHSLALGVIAWGMLLGVGLQVHRPDQKLAALLAALAAPIAIAMGEMLTGTYTLAGTAPFIVAILLVAVLHPAARDLVRVPRWNWPMLALAAISAVPWVVYAAGLGKAAHGDVPEWDVEHLTFMAALAILAVLWGVVGASSHRGSQFAAGASLVAAGSIGLQSLIFPGVLSGLSTPWAIAALGWCLAYGGAAVVRVQARNVAG